VRLSVVLSVHNRSKLLARALETYLWQTLPKEEWEVVLVDDCSTEDLRAAYAPFVGRMNLRHVAFDHRRHPLWKARNPSWRLGEPEDWFHTPALTTNAGCHLARGEAILLCHPEVMHAPGNFALGSEMCLRRAWAQRDLKKVHDVPPPGRDTAGAFVAGRCWLGTQATNRHFDADPFWGAGGWDAAMRAVGADGLDYYGKELYWYCAFVPRGAVAAVGGVDFAYLDGVAAEDDDFRVRIVRSGRLGIYERAIEALHQDHSDEGETHRDRSQLKWKEGLARNRALYYGRRETGFPEPANAGTDWTAMECVVEDRMVSVAAATT